MALKFKLANHRYGKEECLAIYVAEISAPEFLLDPKFADIFSPVCKQPVNFSTSAAETTAAGQFTSYGGSVNSKFFNPHQRVYDKSTDSYRLIDGLIEGLVSESKQKNQEKFNQENVKYAHSDKTQQPLFSKPQQTSRWAGFSADDDSGSTGYRGGRGGRGRGAPQPHRGDYNTGVSNLPENSRLSSWTNESATKWGAGCGEGNSSWRCPPDKPAAPPIDVNAANRRIIPQTPTGTTDPFAISWRNPTTPTSPRGPNGTPSFPPGPTSPRAPIVAPSQPSFGVPPPVSRSLSAGTGSARQHELVAPPKSFSTTPHPAEAVSRSFSGSAKQSSPVGEESSDEESPLDRLRQRQAAAAKAKVDPVPKAKTVPVAPVVKREAAAPAAVNSGWWYYRAPDGVIHGPFKTAMMRAWEKQSYFRHDLPIMNGLWSDYKLLGDVIKESGNPFTEEAEALAQSGEERAAGVLQQPLAQPKSAKAATPTKEAVTLAKELPAPKSSVEWSAPAARAPSTWSPGPAEQPESSQGIGSAEPKPSHLWDTNVPKTQPAAPVWKPVSTAPQSLPTWSPVPEQKSWKEMMTRDTAPQETPREVPQQLPQEQPPLLTRLSDGKFGQDPESWDLPEEETLMRSLVLRETGNLTGHSFEQASTLAINTSPKKSEPAAETSPVVTFSDAEEWEDPSLFVDLEKKSGDTSGGKKAKRKKKKQPLSKELEMLKAGPASVTPQPAYDEEAAKRRLAEETQMVNKELVVRQRLEAEQKATEAARSEKWSHVSQLNKKSAVLQQTMPDLPPTAKWAVAPTAVSAIPLDVVQKEQEELERMAHLEREFLQQLTFPTAADERGWTPQVPPVSPFVSFGPSLSAGRGALKSHSTGRPGDRTSVPGFWSDEDEEEAAPPVVSKSNKTKKSATAKPGMKSPPAAKPEKKSPPGVKHAAQVPHTLGGPSLGSIFAAASAQTALSSVSTAVQEQDTDDQIAQWCGGALMKYETSITDGKVFGQILSGASSDEVMEYCLGYFQKEADAAKFATDFNKFRSSLSSNTSRLTPTKSQTNEQTQRQQAAAVKKPKKKAKVALTGLNLQYADVQTRNMSGEAVK